MNSPDFNDGSDAARYQAGPHVLAVALAVALLPLIVVGAGVTSKGAGMAYPDWPTSGGSLLNPPGWWQGEKTLWEHGHRLLGWTVGMLAIVSAVFSWRRGTTLRALACGALLAIVIQGVLGGLRVREISTALAMVHGIWGQVCFSLACVVALLTSRGWLESGPAVKVQRAGLFQGGTLAACVCAFLQLVFGAAWRHFSLREALAAHLLWAVVVMLVLGWVTMWMLEQYSHVALLRKLGRALAALIGLQIVLGATALLVTVMGGEWPVSVRWTVPSAHVAVGAMLLACTLLVTLSGRRLLRPVTDGTNAAAAALATP